MIGLNQCKLLDGGTTFFKGSTCLVEACLNRDMGMIDLLLKYGARDDDCKVRIIELTMKSLTYLFILFIFLVTPYRLLMINFFCLGFRHRFKVHVQ